MSSIIPFHKSYLPLAAEQDLLRRLKSGRLEGGGPSSIECEKLISSILGTPFVLLTSSCTTALEAAIAICGLEDGDEVILPSFTFVSSVNAIVRAGGTPVFVDVDSNHFCIDVDQVNKAITSRTRVIMPVHYAGFSTNMSKILELAEKHHLKIVEDAAQAFLCSYNDSYLGTIGDFGCVSFHDTKVFSAGEGGALITRSESDYKRACTWRDKGTNRQEFINGKVDKYGWVAAGTNAGMNELSASLLLSQLHLRSEILSRRKILFNRYMEAFQPMSNYGIKVMQPPVWNRELNYHFFYLVMDNAERAKRVIDNLLVAGIQAVQHYPPLHSSEYAQKHHLSPAEKLPNVDHVTSSIVRLPLYTDMSAEEQEKVISTMQQILTNK